MTDFVFSTDAVLARRVFANGDVQASLVFPPSETFSGLQCLLIWTPTVDGCQA